MNSIIEPAFKNIDNSVAVAFSSSNFYVPYLSVVLFSLVQSSSKDINYDIVVFTQDISDENQKTLKSFICKENISLRFFNVKEIFKNKEIYTPVDVPTVTLETYFRVMAPAVFEKYPKVLFCDSDTLIREDIAQLYRMDISEYPLAATEELLFQSAFIQAKRNVNEFLKTLGLSNPRRYFQAGVILFNCDYCNRYKFTQTILKKIQKKNYEMVDQDVLNETCEDNFLMLGNEWNYAPISKKSEMFLSYMPDDVKEKYYSINNPKIIHFIGAYWKPWNTIDNNYDREWWMTARKSPYYEELITRLSNNSIDKKEFVDATLYIKYLFKYYRYIICSKIMIGPRRKTYIERAHAIYKVIKKTKLFIKRYEYKS